MNTENRLKLIFKASVITILVNIGLGIFKAIVGVLSHSIAITMDAINNFTDAGSSFITILSSYFAAKSPDKKHPFGYGRTEYLGTLLIAIIILYAGITSLVESIKSIINPQAAEYSGVALFIISVAVVAKAALSLYVSSVGKKANSDSLMAAAKESIGDIAISIATLVAAIVYIYAHVSIEAWLGVIIAFVILKAGFEILQETISKILGTGGDVELVKNIKKAVSEFDEVIGAYDLVLHNYGPDTYHGSINIEIDHDKSVGEVYKVIHALQLRIMHEYNVILVFGMYAVDTDSPKMKDLRNYITTYTKSIPNIESFHAVYIDPDNNDIYCDFVVDYELKDWDKVKEDFIKYMHDKYPNSKTELVLETKYV